MALLCHPPMDSVCWWGACAQLWVGPEVKTDRLSFHPLEPIQHSGRPALAIIPVLFNPSCLRDAQGFGTALLMGFPEFTGGRLPCLSQRR